LISTFHSEGKKLCDPCQSYTTLHSGVVFKAGVGTTLTATDVNTLVRLVVGKHFDIESMANRTDHVKSHRIEISRSNCSLSCSRRASSLARCSSMLLGRGVNI
jgi:hypothetical protein